MSKRTTSSFKAKTHYFSGQQWPLESGDTGVRSAKKKSKMENNIHKGSRNRNRKYPNRNRNRNRNGNKAELYKCNTGYETMLIVGLKVLKNINIPQREIVEESAAVHH